MNNCCGGNIKSEGYGCCSKNQKTLLNKKLIIDFMYLDLSTCDRCQSTDFIIDKVVSDLDNILKEIGYTITLNKIHIKDEECALKNNFLSSPTIRINGKDIILECKESNCISCGDICGTNVNCRDWEWNGKTYDSPPKGMLIDIILRFIYDNNFGKSPDYNNYQLPENIKNFFEMSRKIKK